MKHDNGKSVGSLILRGLASGLTVGVGVFLIVHSWNFSQVATIGLGFLWIIIGLMLAGLPGRSWLGTFAFIIYGFYQLAKGVGIIEGDYLRYIVGIPLVIIGIYGFYKMMTDDGSRRDIRP
jgi:hypothetical protein